MVKIGINYLIIDFGVGIMEFVEGMESGGGRRKIRIQSNLLFFNKFY